MDKNEHNTKSNIRNNIIGALFVFLTTICFTSSVSIGKYISPRVSISHIIFWKSVVGITVISVLVLLRGKTKIIFRKMNKDQTKWTIFRAIVGTIVVFSLFSSFYYGELSKLGSIANLNPILTVFLAYLILKEELNAKILIAVLVAVVGVLLIVGNPFTVGFSWAYPLIFLSMITLSLESVSIRKMNVLGLDIVIIAGSAMLLALFVSIPMVLIEGISYSWETFLWLLLIGGIDVIGHLSISNAGRYLPARTMSIFTLVSVFEYMILGLIFFGESLTLFKVLGALFIIVASTIAIIVSSSRKVGD